MKSAASKCALDTRANPLNPCHPAYHLSRGASASEAQARAAQSKPVLDNRSGQLNPNNPEYPGTRPSVQPGKSAPSPSKQHP